MTDLMDPGRMECRSTRAQLKAEARRLRLEGRARAAALTEVREHLSACPSCRRRLGTRLGRVEARDALKRRAMPDGVLDGLFDDIQARVPHGPAGGGMSTAFLDAPQALRVWRSAAMAAMVVLGVGTAIVVAEFEPSSSSGHRPDEVTLRDMPAGLLPTWERSTRMVSLDPAAAPATEERRADPDNPAALMRLRSPAAVPSSHTVDD